MLAPYTTFGIGGPADCFVVARSENELIEAIHFAKEKNIPFFILGTGANILIGDKGFRGLVIKNEANKSEVSKETEERKVFLTAESGATIAELIKITQEKGLSGLEHFAGIPSSVGGALWQNLHFLNPDRSRTVFIGDILESAVILGIEGTSESTASDSGRTPFARMMVDCDYFQFGYDSSSLHSTHDVVLSATFALTAEDPKVITERINANLAWRAAKHPANAVKTSAGSIFKKIEGHGAGRLIEQVGLKGYHMGGAKISDEHANFIINEHGASAKDVRNLVDLVTKKVKNELGLDMQIEISFVGEF